MGRQSRKSQANSGAYSRFFSPGKRPQKLQSSCTVADQMSHDRPLSLGAKRTVSPNKEGKPHLAFVSEPG